MHFSSIASRVRRCAQPLFLALTVSLSPATAQNSAYVFTHLAGSTGGPGAVDGPLTSARFNHPMDLAFDAEGNAYVSDYGNGLLRKVSSDGTVSTLAGKVGNFEAVDGTGQDAHFHYMGTVRVAASGDLLIANGTSLRRVTRAGQVTTALTATGVDFWAFTVDSAGVVYVADGTNHVIRKISAAGEATILAGAVGQTGSQDGVGADARFNQPRDIELAPWGDLLVIDASNKLIRSVSPTGEVHTIAGAPGYGSAADGVGSNARFAFPRAAAVDSIGFLYVLDNGAGIRKVDTILGRVTTPFAATDYRVLNDATNIAIDATGTALFVTGTDDCIWRFPLGGTGARWTGVPVEKGSTDGTGDAARFFDPQYVAVSSSGELYVSDQLNHTIRKITPAGVVTTVAGSATEAGHVDGPALSARFQYPAGLAFDGAGNLFIADDYDATIRKLSPAGDVTTIVGQAGDQRVVDGAADVARFRQPGGLTIDAAGNIYVADGNIGSCIRKITPEGVVSTLAGDPLDGGWRDGTGADARFFGISGLAMSPVGDVLVADSYTNSLRKVTADGVVTTLPGCSPYDQVFQTPRCMVVGAGGTLFVTDYMSVRRVSDGTVTLAAGPGTYEGSADGTGVNATFNNAVGIAATPDGTLYVVDTGNACIRKGVLTTLTVDWAAPGAIVAGTALSATQLNATCNLPGTFAYTPAAGTALAAGEHTLSVTFTPTDSVNFSSVTKTVKLTVREANYAGTYFGTVGNGHGTWALHVNRDNTGTLLAYLSGAQTAVVSPVTIAADGTFSVSGHELVATTPAGTAGRTYTITGTAGMGRVTAQAGGLGEELSASIDLGAATVSAASYTAGALYHNTGATYAVVGQDGRALVVIVTPTAIDTATGTIGSDGRLSVTTAAGATLTAALNAATGGLSTAYTPAGSSTAVEFAGIADSVASTTRPMNISARAYCSTGNSVTIGGFVVTGTAPKRVLIRAVGPTLTTQGIGQNEVLQDPVMEVHHGAAIVAQNDNWGDNANAAEITSVGRTIGANALASGDTQSSALLTTLDPGVYTFVVKGKNDTSGIVLLEVYDADAGTPAADFVNISARAQATTGNGVAIGGFVISGNAPKRVLLRAVGPTLTTQGLIASEVLADPLIELHRGSATIATNDDWGSNTNRADIVAIGARIGATPFAAGDTRSSALLTMLPPGVYTFIAKGKNDTSGIVLVEVYDAD